MIKILYGWMKSKMKAKNKLYKQYIKNGRFESDFVFIECGDVTNS